MTDGAASCLSIALRCVNEAFKLDSENRTKDAYCQYLSCIIYISQVLKDDAWDKDMKLVHNEDTSKLFKLLQHCQERVAAIALSTASPTDTTDPSNSPKAPARQERPHQLSPTTQSTQVTPQHLHPGQVPLRKVSDGKGPLITKDTSPAQQAMNWSLLLPSPPASPLPTSSSGSHISSRQTSLGKSQTDNQQLIVAYRMRMMNSNMAIKTGAPPSKSNSMSKSLSVLRKMSENMAIAQARENALRKKIEERQQRVQEEANRRFGTSTLITKEKQEQRYIYTKILEFEQETVWPKQLRERLKVTADDPDLINEIVSKIFSCEDHPLTRFLRQYQYYVYKKLSPLVKDVGFPDVESAGKAEKEGTHNQEDDKEQKNTVVDENRDEGNDRTITEQIESTNSETNARDERRTKVLENIEDKSYENMGSETSLPEEKEDDNGEETLVDGRTGQKYEGSVEGSPDHVALVADLARLRGLLENDSSGQVEKTDDSKPSEDGNGSEQRNPAGRAVIADDDSVFHELEADMLEWDNSDSDRESETNDARLPHRDCNSPAEDHSGMPESLPTRGDCSSPAEDRSGMREDLPPQGDCTSLAEDHSGMREDLPPQGDCTSLAEDHSGMREDLPPQGDCTSLAEDHSGMREDLPPQGDCSSPTEDHSGMREDLPPQGDCSSPTEDHSGMREDLPPQGDCTSLAEDHSGMREDLPPQGDCSSPTEDHSGMREDLPPQGDCSSPTEDHSGMREDLPPQGDCSSPTEDHSGMPESNTGEEYEEKPTTDENSSRQAKCYEENAETDERGRKDDSGEASQDQSDTAEIRAKLNETLVDIRFFLEKLHKLTVLAYEQLDTPLGRDQCYASLEAPFFKHLWPMLLAVLRRVNYEKEVQLASVMTEYIVLKPRDIGVQERLAMENREVLAKTGNTYPYQMAVEELHKVVTCVCPLEKLECLVRTSRAICQCVEDYWESMGKSRHSSETSIGCDDLLPILTFVIVKSGMAQLISECNAMEEFIPEGYLMGEEGYCLTSLVTALAYLATLSK